MNVKKTSLTLAIKITLLTGSFASFASMADLAEDKNIEVITISNQRHNTLDENQSFAQGKTTEPDLANWLASVPGANINSNGPVTGIAQYRGLFGDRVSTTIDGQPVIGAGPNAMDTPLSYSTPLIVDTMTVYRGIAPVSAGMNTLGGAIDIDMRKATVASDGSTEFSGDLQAGYRSNNSASTLSGVMNGAAGDFALMLYGNTQTGDSMESGDGTVISPTDFDKTQAGLDLRYLGNSSSAGFSYNYTNTIDSGTPALPMDIEYIDSHHFNLDGKFEAGAWQGEWALGYLDADHGMTNYLMRAHDETKRRLNTALADTANFTMSLSREFSIGELVFGIDGYSATHDSVITNPNNDMFEVVNFNNVQDERYGFFTEWKNNYRQTEVQLGLRVKHIIANADVVSADMGMSSMMNMSSMPSAMSLLGDIADDFNNAERKVSDSLVDVALSTQTQLSESLSLYVGAGIKNRAPSYQERYLWMPMEATAGLADGHTYIGDINLEAETAYQSDIGLNWQTNNFMFAPHVFFQNINNYIQGTPMGEEDATARMVASMMSSDDNPLQFSNVDARLYGVDFNWYYNLSSNFQVSGLASYVKGERRDVEDNLYRIAPLNGQVSVSYHDENVITNLTLVAVSSQEDVSITNTEQATAGYGLVNIDLEYFVTNALTLRGGVDNLLNKEYQNHLGGYNRVKEVATPVMSRLPSEGLSAWAEVTYSF